MFLYRGSNVEVREPRLLKVQRDLDFGKGFYTTSDFDQAKSWALRTTRIRGYGKPLISCYDVNEEQLKKLKILQFEKADKDWLDFISANRKGIVTSSDWVMCTRMGWLLRNCLVMNMFRTENKADSVKNRLKLIDVPKQTRDSSGVTVPEIPGSAFSLFLRSESGFFRFRY